LKLALTAQHRPGETATSIFSRQAARNMCVSARHHGREIDLPFQDVINGSPPAIARLEDLAGMSRGTLSPSTLTQSNGRTFVLNGQRITAGSLQRSVVVACPLCLIEDMHTGPYEPALNAYGRASNEIVHLRTCRKHNVPHVLIGRPTSNYTHDFAAILRENFDAVPRLADDAKHRRTSDFEVYLEDRLSGNRVSSSWLDTLGFSAAARACEIFGAVAEFGTTPNLKTLTEEDWARAGATGFQILGHGISKTRELLLALQRREGLTGVSGPQHAYGRLYQWLAKSDDVDLAPLKDMVRGHIIETMPVGAGDEIFGVKVTQRRLHSLRSAAVQHGVHPKTAAKLLQRAGLAPHEVQGLTDNQVLLPAAPVDALMTRAARAIPRQSLHGHLDISRTHLTHLLNAGHITPIVEADDLDALFDPQDLDAFLASLKENAEVVTEPTPNQMPMTEAVKRACCGVPEVLSLLFGRKLDWVGWLKGGRGYNAILVSLTEVKAKTELPALDGITVDAINYDFGIPDTAVKRLIQIGALPIVTATNPKNRCPIKIVPYNEYRHFKHKYVSLRDLSRESGRWSRHIPPELAARGIYPAPELREVGAYIFLREQLI